MEARFICFEILTEFLNVLSRQASASNGCLDLAISVVRCNAVRLLALRRKHDYEECDE